MKNKDTKLVRVDFETHELIRLEAVRQSLKPNTVVTMSDVIKQLTRKLKRKG